MGPRTKTARGAPISAPQLKELKGATVIALGQAVKNRLKKSKLGGRLGVAGAKSRLEDKWH